MNRYAERNMDKILAFAERLEGFDHPEDFADAWAVCGGKVCGFYLGEAVAIWHILRREKIRSIAEVGRNLGGGLCILACAARDLEYLWSIDVVAIPEVDVPLAKWLATLGVICKLDEADSASISIPAKVPFTGQDLWDLVYIDGEHTGPGVKADIEKWRGRCRLIAFHDYADEGRNYHRTRYNDVVDEISAAAARYGWERTGQRGRSEIVFRTENY